MSEELTPEQKLELAKAEAETAKERARAAELEERSKRLDAQNRDLTVRDTIANALASTGIKFHEPKDVFKLVSSEEGVEIHPSADGRTLHCSKDGIDISFTALVEDFTLRHQFIADGRSLRHLKADEKKITCLDELPDRADRIAFISANGEDAFAKLPQHRPPKLADPAKTMTKEEYLSLRVPDRAKIAGQVGEDGVSKILRRSKKQ